KMRIGYKVSFGREKTLLSNILPFASFFVHLLYVCLLPCIFTSSFIQSDIFVAANIRKATYRFLPAVDKVTPLLSSVVSVLRDNCR
ncbi:hypothetical protein VIGAN_01267500, partial [Vigna angularis var. angularis]